jgi:protocatechuate 3,4-dioxygenase beta subunit
MHNGCGSPNAAQSMPDPIRYRRPSRATQPAYLHPSYASSTKRAPTQPLVVLAHTVSETTGPQFTENDIRGSGCDLTQQPSGEPLGERIIVSGRVLDEDGCAVPHTVVELWQANAAGRYLHDADHHNAPLDPNFTGCGHTFTDGEGSYRFVTVKPGCYPWRNHHNAWRPAHIHFSIFGPAFATRLVTQMYFPGDPLLPYDPLFNSIADENARNRLISTFDWKTTVPETALGYRFDIVLRGREQTPMDAPRVRGRKK